MVQQQQEQQQLLLGSLVQNVSQQLSRRTPEPTTLVA